MKKRLIFKSVLLALAIPALLVSCQDQLQPEPEKQVDENKEVVSNEAVSKGRPVTISAGLPVETKIAHGLNGTAIHPTWETGDEVKVSFTLDGRDYVETFTLKDGAGTQCATFYCADSQLQNDTKFTIDYVDNKYPDGWAEQDGTVENLPECLSVSGVTLSTETITLEPALIYFHVVAAIPSGSSYAYAYLNKLEGSYTMYTAPGTAGAVTVKPENSFSGTVDFYIATKVDGTTNTTFQIVFGNGVKGISLDGQAFDIAGASYKFNWSPSKNYTAGTVYKIADKTFTTASAAQTMPR